MVDSEMSLRVRVVATVATQLVLTNGQMRNDKWQMRNDQAPWTATAPDGTTTPFRAPHTSAQVSSVHNPGK